MYPLKLEKLHSYGTFNVSTPLDVKAERSRSFKVLPIQLLNRTPYLKYVEELIAQLKGRLCPARRPANRVRRYRATLFYGDLVSKLYISLPNKFGLFAYIRRINTAALHITLVKNEKAKGFFNKLGQYCVRLLEELGSQTQAIAIGIARTSIFLELGYKAASWVSGDTKTQVSVSNFNWERLGQFTASQVESLQRSTGLFYKREATFVGATFC